MKTKKITRATVKAFIKRNRENLLIKVESDFDGMQDMVVSVEDTFTPAEPRKYWDRERGCEVEGNPENQNTMGLVGVWFVGSGRDSCSAYETEFYRGFRVSNCCGSWIVAIAKV